MAPEYQIRRAKLDDAAAIADFVNRARRKGGEVNRLMVAQRFSEVGFMLAELNGQIVAMLGWQVENLITRVTDFLVAPTVNPALAGRALVERIEEQAKLLQAEAAMLFLPPRPSPQLISFWEQFGYKECAFDVLPKQWRLAAAEWNPNATNVMVKVLREDMVRRPI
ncbi:MAG: hypothetical protein RBT75_01590 [Anaerolineae bacterium]|jgi:N-acetylglutamate synthase-like GNAT family acetyltransferase|nr:hypothetical protein [Anaerolineae bacterium]